MAEPTRTADAARSSLAIGLGATVAATAAWALLASRAPDTTYHLAPLLAVVAWPALVRRSHTRLDRPVAASIVATSVLVVATVAAALAASGHLQGPTLASVGTAPAETSLAIAVGAVYGWRVATRARMPWWQRAR